MTCINSSSRSYFRNASQLRVKQRFWWGLHGEMQRRMMRLERNWVVVKAQLSLQFLPVQSHRITQPCPQENHQWKHVKGFKLIYEEFMIFSSFFPSSTTRIWGCNGWSREFGTEHPSRRWIRRWGWGRRWGRGWGARTILILTLAAFNPDFL